MKKKTINIIAFFIGVCVAMMSCNLGKTKIPGGSVQKKTLSKTMSNKDQSFVRLKESVVCKGDTMSYKLLKERFQKTSYPYECLYYAIVMANKYDYVPANYDVYSCVEQLVTVAHFKFNERTWMFVVPFLEKGAIAGDNKCKETLFRYNHNSPSI